MKTTPKAFYKYQPPTEQAINNLAARSVFFCSPEDFNDPFDCAIEARPKNLTQQDIDRFRDHLAATDGRYHPGVTQLYSKNRKESRELILPRIQHSLERLRRDTVQKIGVACFTESPHNTLMWSHYAGHGKGFCLELSSRTNFFSRVREVEYSQKFPILDAVDQLITHNTQAFWKLLTTKSLNWEYEREWRVFNDKPRSLVSYGENDLLAIYFGPNCHSDTQHSIIEIVRERHPKAKFYFGKLSTTEFRIDFEQNTLPAK